MPWLDDGDLHISNSDYLIATSLRYVLEPPATLMPQRLCPCTKQKKGTKDDTTATFSLRLERAILKAAADYDFFKKGLACRGAAVAGRGWLRGGAGWRPAAAPS